MGGFVLREVWAFQFPVKRQNDGLGEELEKKKKKKTVVRFEFLVMTMLGRDSSFCKSWDCTTGRKDASRRCELLMAK